MNAIEPAQVAGPGSGTRQDLIRLAAAENAPTVTPGTAAAAAAQPAVDHKIYEAGFRTLFALFVLAVLLESALAILFNWRPFVETFNARAVKPLVSFLAAILFVTTFGVDLVTRLVNIFLSSAYAEGSSMGYTLSAMVLAGGSAGVNNLLVA